MARDRKRAKQRRDRRARTSTAGGAAASSAARAPEAPEAPADRGDAEVHVPGPLDHASAEVDEFNAALARGAAGVGDSEGAVAGTEEPTRSDRDEKLLDDELQLADVGGGRMDGGGDRVGGGGEPGDQPRPSGAPLREGNRAIAFLRASWAELQRVQWPDRRQVTQATAVVLGFVAVAGVYLGVADVVAKDIVEFVI